MVSDDARKVIDNLTREELLIEINRDNRSRFQGDNYAYLKTRLALVEEQEGAEREQRRLQAAQDGNQIALDANNIAQAASSTARKAYSMSALAVVVALVAIVVSLITQCAKA